MHTELQEPVGALIDSFVDGHGIQTLAMELQLVSANRTSRKMNFVICSSEFDANKCICVISGSLEEFENSIVVLEVTRRAEKGLRPWWVLRCRPRRDLSKHW